MLSFFFLSNDCLNNSCNITIYHLHHASWENQVLFILLQTLWRRPFAVSEAKYLGVTLSSNIALLSSRLIKGSASLEETSVEAPSSVAMLHTLAWRGPNLSIALPYGIPSWRRILTHLSECHAKQQGGRPVAMTWPVWPSLVKIWAGRTWQPGDESSDSSYYIRFSTTTWEFPKRSGLLSTSMSISPRQSHPHKTCRIIQILSTHI